MIQNDKQPQRLTYIFQHQVSVVGYPGSVCYFPGQIGAPVQPNKYEK